MQGTARVTVYFNKDAYTYETMCSEVNGYLRTAFDRIDHKANPVTVYPTPARQCDEMHMVELVVHQCSNIDQVVDSIKSVFPAPLDDLYEDCHVRKVEVSYVVG